MSAVRISSVQKFLRLTTEMRLEMRRDAIAELHASADDLVESMQAAAPFGKTGNLRRSIRKEKGNRDTQVKVMAGGPLTTVAARQGHGTYDYSRWAEFGTSQAEGKPFFWPMWRLRRKKIRSAMSRKITKAIKKRSAAGHG